MKINELNIIKYGPLSGVGLKDFKKFNLVYGRNEQGKTLLLEAMVKFLIKQKSKRNKIEGLDRVKENPEGYLYIENENEKIKYPENGSFLDANSLSIEDFYNIFLIRDSDLNLKEDKYFVDFTNKLIGLKTEKINKIKNTIQDIGNMTDSYNQISSTKDNNKLGDKLILAEDMIDKINKTIENLKKQNYDKLTRDKIECKTNLEKLKEKKELLERAKKREEYETGINRIKELKEYIKKLTNFTDINQKDLDKLKGLKRDINRLEVDIEDKNKKIKNEKSKLEKINRRIEEIDNKKSILDRKKNLYDNLKENIKEKKVSEDELNKLSKEKNNIEKEFDNINQDYINIEKKKKLIEQNQQLLFEYKNAYKIAEKIKDSLPAFKKAGSISFVLFMIFLILTGFNFNTMFLAGSGIFLLVSGVLGYIYFDKNKKLLRRDNLFVDLKTVLSRYVEKSLNKDNIIFVFNKIKEEFEDIKERYEDKLRDKKLIEQRYEEKKDKIQNIDKIILELKTELSIESVDKIMKRIDKFVQKYEESKNEFAILKAKKENIVENINRLENEYLKLQKDIKSFKADKEEILNKAEVANLAEYHKLLKRKQKIIEEIKIDINRLNTKYGENIDYSLDNIEKIIKNFKEIVDNYREYKGQALNYSFSEEKYNKIKNKINDIEEKIRTIEEEISSFSEILKDIERQVNNEILINENRYLYCETVVELESVKDKLKSFIKKYTDKFKNCKKAIDIMNKIEDEETERVSELFGENTNAVNYFKKITSKSFEEIIFDKESVKIKVKDKMGKILNPEQLSGGTIDQLYLSVRLAMGMKIFNDSKGFFLFDDPFIKSDIDRLKTQLDILFKLADEGFQFFYFSAKKAVLDFVEKSKNSEIVSIYKL